VTGGGGAPDILRRIAERRRERLAEHRRRHPADVAAAAAVEAAAPPADTLTARDNPFLAALSRPRGRAGPGPPTPAIPATPPTPATPAIPAPPALPAIIAEVKMGSPRLGSLHGRVDPLAQARCYAANGAAALSVVVEPDFFHGDYELLAACRAACGLPAVAKDFVVDPLQLVWAQRAGADAVLLIAALHSPAELARYAWMARGLGLVPLIETHDAADLALLAGEPWELVGINNRDLRTFEVDLERSIALLPWLPRGALRVAESGIRDALDVALLADSGFDALLIGESLLLAADPGAALRALLGAAPAASATSAGSAG
jgi:indole-3-glycerol phosphate synthase